MKCGFDKSKNLIRAYGLYLKNGGNKSVYEPTEEFLNSLAESFDNPEVAAKAVEDLVRVKNPTRTGSPTEVKNVELVGNYRRNPDSTNIASYYVGDSGYRRMVSKFRKDILGHSILDIDLRRGTFEFIAGDKIVNPNLNITLLQSNILKYKQKLVNDLLRIINPSGTEIALSETIDDYSLTKAIDDVIELFENSLTDENRAIIESNGYYDSYVILKNFDRLLDRYASYITIDDSYRKNNWEGVRKYSLTPKVKHYSGFSTDEGADISKQVSDLAETILKVIPEIDAGGNIIENSVVGLDGFNGSMMTLKTALLYSQSVGNNSSNYRKAYSKGTNELVNVFQKIISDFIENNSRNVGNATAFNDYRQTYLHNKLRGISKYLMSDKTPSDIKNMFVQMFVKTVPSTYRVYTTDRDTSMFTGKDLKSRMVVTQKKAFENVIKGGLNLIQSGSRKRASELSRKYDISINKDGDSEVLTITNLDTDQQLVLAYTINDNTFTPSIIDGNDSLIEDFMRDVYSYVIPDTYATCIFSSTPYNWQDDFIPFIVAGAKEIKFKLGQSDAGTSLNLSDANGISLLRFNSLLLDIGKRLGVIYGDSIHNTIKNLSGNNLPLFQLTSLEYNWRMCLDDAKEDTNDYNPIKYNIFWDNEDLMVQPQRRSDISFNGNTKSPVKLNLEELLKLSIFDDFLFPYLNSSEIDAAIYFQNTTFSDKSTHFLPGFKLKQLLKGKVIESIFGDTATLENIIKDAIEHGTGNILEWNRQVQRDQTQRVLERILNDYEEVFRWGILPEEDFNEDIYAKNVYTAALKLDEKLKNIDIQTLRDAFDKSHVIFREEIHAISPKLKSLGKSRLNETMLSVFASTLNKAAWDSRNQKDRAIFIRDLQKTKLYGFTPGIQSQIDSIKKIEGINHDKFYNPVLHEYSLVSDDGELNPIAEVYFALDRILSNQFNNLTVGDFWSHTNKNKDGKTSEEYLTYSEANRFVNQIKRNVIFGSTIHPFAQGIKNDEGYEIGVTPEIEIAIISDQKGLFYTPAGVDSDGDAQDGCGWCTALQSILENNSLLDAKVGDNKKTILHDVDHRYGAPTLLKWAVYSLTNSVRRNGKESVASVENLVSKMYGKDITGFNADLNKEYQIYKSKNGSIYIYDLRSCTYKEIASIRNDGVDALGRTKYTTIYTDGSVSESRAVSTLYDIDQILGGAWTFDKNSDGSYSGNEASSYLLADIVCKYGLRDKQIAYAVNNSGCKVGAANLNSRERWTDNLPLRSYRVSTKYAGAMMNADHELDMAEVTEMSQMISALVEDGNYTELATNIYREIGEIAFNNAKTQKYIQALESEDKSKVAELLGKSLIASFQTGNKDTIGLAQAFVKKLDTEFKRAKLAGESPKYTIPFSDPTIYGAFVSDVVSRFNKDAIRRKYEGFAGIMNPSYNMMQYYRNSNGEVKLFQQFNEECKQKLEPIIGTLPLGYSNWVEIAQEVTLYTPDLVPILNPMLVPITKNQIDFEDTVILMHSDGTLGDIIYINTQEKYDLVKHLMNLDDYTIYNHTAKPKNLRGTNTTFNVAGEDILGNKFDFGTFSIYDIDSVRASLYLQKGISDNDPYRDQKLALITKVCGNIDPNNQLAYCQSLTQQFLKKLDLGKVATLAINNGEIVDFSRISLGHQDTFGGLEEDPIVYYATDYNVRPAEIIIGRYQFDKLGLNDQDHIWQIKDKSYFVEKLKSQFKSPIFNIEEKTWKKLYDKVLYHKGQPFLIKIGNVTHGDDGIEETKCNQNNIVGDDLRWESEVILTNESNDDNYFNKFKFSYISDDSGNKYPIITVNSYEDFEELQASDFFEDFYRNNYYNRDTEYNESKLIDKLAETKFEAFKEALKFVGARIPTQAMQSFIPADVIAVTDSKLNQTYFPVSGMFIEGADLDGDKIFLLTSTLLKNGTIQAGSALQKFIGYKHAVKLAKPKGTTFQIDKNGVPVDGNLLAQFMIPINEWDETTINNFINVVNPLIEGSLRNSYTGINFINSSNIDPELFNKQVSKFLDLLNKHSHTKSYIRDSIDTLKSRVFSGIRDVTLGAQSQMKAQITVDSCTEKFKTRATNTLGGKVEKEISPFIPSSKYHMQVQGILGKADVGIGAVSLKTYFLLSTAYNRKVDNIVDLLTKGRFTEAKTVLDTLVINNPFGGITSLANTNFDKILDLENKYDWIGKNEFFDLVRQLKQSISRISAPEDLSAVISLAADNMKDLALPKLNASEDLIDIYTTSFMLGIPFDEIANIMTSPVFTMIIESGKNNIFDSYTEGLRVKDLVKEFLLDRKNNWHCNQKLGEIEVMYENYTHENLPNDWYYNNNIISKVIEEFIKNDGIIDKTSFREHYDESIPPEEQGKQILKSESYNLYRYLQFIKERNDILSKNPRMFKDVQKLNNLLNIVEEMSTLGRQASINQGLKTHAYDFYKFGKTVEDLVNNRFGSPREPYNFSFREFLLNESYRKNMILMGREKFKGFNILEALSLSPNFFNMSKLQPYVEDLLRSSAVYDLTTKMADSFKTIKQSLGESDFKELSRYIQDVIIFNFLHDSNIELNLDEIKKITGNDIEIYRTYKSTDLTSLHSLKLDSGLNITSFKHIMETTIIPYLKSIYKDNSFISDLLPGEHRITGKTIFTLPIPMMNIDKDENLGNRYTKYLQDFNAIATHTFAGIKIGDLFFIYNLLVNKNQFGQQSLTRIFEDLINTRDVPEVLNGYYRYIGELDGGRELNNISRTDASYRLAKYVPGTKVISDTWGTDIQIGECPLDLPFLCSDFRIYQPQQLLQRWTPISKLNPEEVIDALVNSLNKTGQKIIVVDDEIVRENNLPTERGFIQNGVIAINKSKFNDSQSTIGVAVHELSHAILAAIKQGDVELRGKYYKLLDKLRDDSDFDSIAELYPDRIGSDLLEEVFCNKLEKLLTNSLNQNSNIELTLVEDGILLQGLKNLFKRDDLTLKDGIFSTVGELIDFSSDMFSYVDKITSDYTKASQKLAALKTKLFNSSQDKFKLEQICK